MDHNFQFFFPIVFEKISSWGWYILKGVSLGANQTKQPLLLSSQTEQAKHLVGWHHRKKILRVTGGSSEAVTFSRTGCAASPLRKGPCFFIMMVILSAIFRPFWCCFLICILVLFYVVSCCPYVQFLCISLIVWAAVLLSFVCMCFAWWYFNRKYFITSRDILIFIHFALLFCLHLFSTNLIATWQYCSPTRGPQCCSQSWLLAALPAEF